MQLLLFFILFEYVNPLKFLVYSPQFAKSHVNFMGKISDILIDSVHEVVMLSPLLDTSLKSAGTKKARVIKIPQCEEAQEYEDFIQISNAANAWTTGNSLLVFQWDAVFSAWISQCNATILHPGLLQSLRDDNFDVAITESIDFCSPGLFHLLKIDKWAVTDSFAINDGNFFYTQTPSIPAYVPSMMGGNTGESKTFYERFDNFFTFCFTIWFNERFFPVYDKMFRSPDIKKTDQYQELFASNSLVFTNSEPLVDFPRPSSARIINIGEIAVSSGHNKLNQT
ncbi:hypothetical protein PENTCL1PPCAC_12609 [Pristionchus entomophagus]|uniref:glucuronosyltransferase n=1 Tax=Pristionchus entomophagus TaxID=358040 RepID=A0AAV5T9N7_9BILA|nr:hypothetical protein PENTCL1PPCAC_12609 [Pristionchus entomophagus]